MVEVFKTNVCDSTEAITLVAKLYERSKAYKVNFDLSDSEKILRVQCDAETINAKFIIEFLQESGYQAEVLPD